MLEALDSGKPLREARDVDIPLAVGHLHHHAGWAELLAYESPGQRLWPLMRQCRRVLP